MENENPLLSRKFLLSLLLIVLSFVLVLVGKIEAKDWLDFSIFLSGIYTVGNVSSKFVKK